LSVQRLRVAGSDSRFPLNIGLCSRRRWRGSLSRSPRLDRCFAGFARRVEAGGLGGGDPVPELTRRHDIKLNADVSLRGKKNYGSVFGGVTMFEQNVRTGFDQESGWLSRLLRPFRGRGEFRRQRERTISYRVAQLLGFVTRISGWRAGREFAPPVGLTAREAIDQNGQPRRGSDFSSVPEFVMLRKLSRILLYVAAVIGVGVPLGALAFVGLALIGF
jgi:hypothetical protein